MPLLFFSSEFSELLRKQTFLSIFLQVQHHTLSQQRIEQTVDPAGHPWLFHDIPDEQAMVKVDCCRVRSRRTDETLEPPVGGVDAVRVVMSQKSGTRPLQSVDQFALAIDTHMALVGVEVGIRQRPADALWQVAGNADHQRFAMLEYPDDFSHGQFMIRNVLKHFTADDQVEAGVGEGQAGHVGRGKTPGAAAMFTQPVMEVEPLTRFLQICRVQVCTGHPYSFQPVGRAGVAAGSAADVQDAIAGLDSQAGEINGNQGWFPDRRQQSFRLRDAK